MQPGHRFSVKLTQEDVGERFLNRRRRAFQQVRNAHMKPAFIEADKTVGVGEFAEFHAQIRRRGAGLQLTEDAGVNLLRRLKEKRPLKALKVDHSLPIRHAITRVHRLAFLLMWKAIAWG